MKPINWVLTALPQHARVSRLAGGVPKRGREHFAVAVYLPLWRLTGYYALRGKCYTPPAGTG
jgi:hypothetical protein